MIIIIQILKILLIIKYVSSFQLEFNFDTNIDIIKHYFQHKHVQYLNIYHFNQKEEKEIEFFKKMSDFPIGIKMFNINQNNNQKPRNIYSKKEKLGIVIDLSNVQSVYQQELLQVFTFTSTNCFLIFINESTSIIESIFKKITMSINTDLKVITENYKVYDIYNPSTLHGGNIIYKHYSNWNATTRNFSTNNKIGPNLYWTRRNMTGIVFQTMVVLPQPFPGTLQEYLMFNDHNRDINSFNRFHAVLMYHVRDYYNYTLNMSMTKSWGYKQPNGTFDGMVRALQLKEIDFGSSPLFLKEERYSALDYGRRTWKLKSAFLFQTPKRPVSFEVFLRPLDEHVWYLTLFACLVIIMLLKITLNNNSIEKVFETTWSNITLFTIGSICQQGAHCSPNAISSRIAVIFVYVFSMLLYQYYSASIVSILVMKPVKFIKTLQDLAVSSLVLGCEDVLYNRDYIQKLENDSLIALLTEKEDIDTFYVEPNVGLPKVAQGGYAYHVELATAYPIISRTFSEDAICNLDEIQLFQLQQMHQPLQKHSPLREMLDHVLHKMDESGLMHRQLNHWHARKPECFRSHPVTSAVGIGDFYPALTMLAIGILLSVFILMCEQLLYLYEVKNVEKRKKLFVKRQKR